MVRKYISKQLQDFAFLAIAKSQGKILVHVQ